MFNDNAENKKPNIENKNKRENEFKRSAKRDDQTDLFFPNNQLSLVTLNELAVQANESCFNKAVNPKTD